MRKKPNMALAVKVFAEYMQISIAKAIKYLKAKRGVFIINNAEYTVFHCEEDMTWNQKHGGKYYFIDKKHLTI